DELEVLQSPAQREPLARGPHGRLEVPLRRSQHGGSAVSLGQQPRTPGVEAGQGSVAAVPRALLLEAGHCLLQPASSLPPVAVGVPDGPYPGDEAQSGPPAPLPLGPPQRSAEVLPVGVDVSWVAAL